MAKVNKKAQVSIFIVIALVLIISGVLFFALKKENIESQIEKESQSPKAEFAGQAELKNYVDSCLQDAVLQGMEIMRLQGGYIVIPENVETLNVKDKENKQVKIINDSFKVVIDLDGEGNRVPYWLSKNRLAIPSIELMEYHLKQYVDLEVNKCVNDFKPFREQKYDVSYSNLDSNVEMSTAVTTKLNFPILMKKGDIETRIDEFVFTIPINIKLIMDMASDITGYEETFTFLEDNAKNLISLYSGVNENMLPPFSQSITNFDCSSVSWSKNSVKERLKRIFEKNLPFLKIENTNFERIEGEGSSEIYDSFIYEFFEEKFPSLNVNFNYNPEWEFNEYDIRPSSGDSLRPGEAIQNQIPLLPKICVYEYKYKYTLDYPVLVEVNDIKSAKISPESDVYYEDSGYNFQFALNSHLCGNQERGCVEGKQYTADFSKIVEELDLTLLPETYFCDEDQKMSEEININTFNSVTNEKLDGVDVYYYCGSFRNNCFIGITDENGELKAKFPKCVNGILHMYKHNYAESKSVLTVYDESERKLVYGLKPLSNINVFVKKVILSNFIKNYHETGVLSLSNLMTPISSEDRLTISAVGPSPISLVYLTPGENKVFLSPGSYDLEISLDGDVKVNDSVINGQLISGFEGRWNFGTTKIGWNITNEEIKNSVTLFALSNFNSSKIEFFNDINDPILKDNGTLEAELLYRCDSIFNNITNVTTCNFSDCEFVKADGTSNYDLVSNENLCEKTYNVTIEKEKYGHLIRPRFS